MNVYKQINLLTKFEFSSPPIIKLWKAMQIVQHGVVCGS